MKEQNKPNLVDIPHEELSEVALRGILEEFATRGGYESEVPLESRLGALMAKLKSGKAKIVFDPDEGTTNLVPL